MSEELKNDEEVVEEALEIDIDFCPSRGFQNEPGFEIDEIVGHLKIPIIKCHSRRHPTPKERVVMLLPDGKTVRIHDYVMIRRCHGKEVVGDVWSLARVGVERALEFAKRLINGIGEKAIVKLAKL